MITASHNPAIYNGIKFKSEYGGSAPAEVTRAIEERLPERPALPRSPQGAIAPVDLKRPFLSKIRTLIEPERLIASPVHVVVDSMYGSAQGYVSQLLSEFGIPYIQIRGARRPLFGGKQPEPLEKNLIPLRAVIAAQRSRRMPTIGVATDGDGDRISAMDERGAFIDAHRTFALILRYLVEERGWRGAVVKSFALTDMANELCREYGLELIEVPIGFKHICEQIMRRDVLIGAEESGSITIRGHIPERDGILCSLLLTEIAATARRPMSAVVDGLLDAVGPHIYHRRDIVVEGRKEVVDRLTNQPPDQIAGYNVHAVETMDGVKLRFKRGWLLFRASGTEPILRIYCEMPTENDVYTLLDESEKLARGDLTLW
jgi:phosphomannomutase